MSFNPTSVHFSKRAYDKKFEVIALAEVDGVRRWVTLDVVNNHKDALEVVRKLRGSSE